MAETDDENKLKMKEFQSINNLSKAKDPSLSILTGTPINNQLSISLARGLNEDENYIKSLSNSRQYTSSFDDLVDHRKSLYACYSNKAITMYNVSTNLKDYTGSTASMFSLNKSVRTQKITNKGNREEKSVNSNVTNNPSNISSPKIKTFKNKIFVFKKNRSSQQWLDDFLRKNIVDEKPIIEKPSKIESTIIKYLI